MTVQVPADSMDLIEHTIVTLRDSARRLQTENENLRRENAVWARSNGDLLDQIEDLRRELRTKDLVIEEMRSLVGSVDTQRPPTVGR